MNKLGRYNERRAWFCRLEYYLNVNFVAEQTGCGIEPHLAYPTVQKFMSFRVCVCSCVRGVQCNNTGIGFYQHIVNVNYIYVVEQMQNVLVVYRATKKQTFCCCYVVVLVSCLGQRQTDDSYQYPL